MKLVAMETLDDSISHTSDEQLVSLQIQVPELHVQKCLQFNKDELIWDVKQQVISSLPKDLKESHNYGLFLPPTNGKAGKFLDEERPLGDYPFPESLGYLELRYKRRVYKALNMEEKQVKQLHTRANLRRMLDHVVNNHVDKVTKFCSRGLDPNFHCPETGETPLTLAVALKQPGRMIMSLVNGGSLLDFRMKDGRTALHRAVEKNNLEALKTLLDLGASPNYKDSRGLSPLYYTVLYGSDPQLTETLLHDHATVGFTDPQGWQEVHQACKHGMVQHLEHLLFYGADMNARNASGNTPLHVCAVNDQESCARVLLFRGADHTALNYANQNPYQVAVIAANLNLAEIILNHRPEDVVPYREAPRYNPRRRASAATSAALSRTHSDPRLELPLGGKPPSPCPSNHSLPPFSSVSTISEASTGSSSTCTHPSGEDSEDTASASVVTEKSITSDSSGVCTSHSGASYESGAENTEPSEIILLPGTMCISVEDYHVPTPGHLQVSCGEIVEVVGVSDCGLLEGRLRDGKEGLVPSFCLQEVKMKGSETLPAGGRPRVEGRRELNAKRVNIMPRRWRMFGEPRTVILHRGKRGFGFVLRGAKATSPLMERQPTEYWPSLQYLDDVDKGGVADMAGLKKGDFLLEINGQDVSQASHEHVVSIIRQSGDLVAMTVVTVQPPSGGGLPDKPLLTHRQCSTLPRKLSTKKAPAPPKRDPRTTLSVGRTRARSMVAGLAEIEYLDRTLVEYDSEGRSTKSSSIESIPNKQSTAVSEGSTPKIASIRSRPSSRRLTAAELEDFFSRQSQSDGTSNYSTLTLTAATVGRMPKVYGSVAAMKRSKARTKITEMTNRLHKDFHSTPDLNTDGSDTEGAENRPERRRSQSQEDIHALNLKNHRHSWACPPHSYHKTQGESEKIHHPLYQDAWKSIEEIYEHVKTLDRHRSSSAGADKNSRIYAETLPVRRKEKLVLPSRTSCPPPTHPPPPPPVGQVVRVDVSRFLGEYANIHVIRESKSTVMSSFRPGDSAKLYASPDSLGTVGYKSDPIQPRRVGGGSSSRSHSLPPRFSNGRNDNRSNTSSEAENSGDSGALYSTFKVTNRQRDSLSSDSGLVSDKGTVRHIKGLTGVSAKYSPAFGAQGEEHAIPNSYPTLGPQNHEPFIPEPDYDSTDEEEISTEKGSMLITFGKGDSDSTLQMDEKMADDEEDTKSIQNQHSPHSEAKRAIQEARERLRHTHKQNNSGGNLTPAAAETPAEVETSFQGELPQTKNDINEESKKNTETPSVPTEERVVEECPLEEAGTEITAVVSVEKIQSPPTVVQMTEDDKPAQTPDIQSDQHFCKETGKVVVEITTGTVKENIVAFEKKREMALKTSTLPAPASKKSDGLRIALTGAQQQTRVQASDIKSTAAPVMKVSKSCPKDFCQDELDKCENSSSGVSSDVETQSDYMLYTSHKEDYRRISGTLGREVGMKIAQKKRDSHSNQYSTLNRIPIGMIRKVRPQIEAANRQMERKPSSPKPAPIIISCKNMSRTAGSGISHTVHGIQDLQSKGLQIIHINGDEESTKATLAGSRAQLRREQEQHISQTAVPRQDNCNKINSEVSDLSRSIDESLQMIRLQVDSLGLAAVNEVDVFTELVPPPPEFAPGTVPAGSSELSNGGEQLPVAIAPPPEFCDRMPASSLGRTEFLQGRLAVGNNAAGRSGSPDSLNSGYGYTDYAYRMAVNRIEGSPRRSAHAANKGPLRTVLTRNMEGAQGIPKTCFPSVPGSNRSPVQTPTEDLGNELGRVKTPQKEFRQKPLHDWSLRDVTDWLESLFLPEYRAQFVEAGITGAKLANMDNNDFVGLGVKQVGHRLNMERSIKRYLK